MKRALALGASLRKLVTTKSFRSVSAVVIFLILGHTFGSYYLKLWGARQLVGGFHISSLSPSDTYTTVDWDELVYFPRALAVAEGYSPLDPWVYHENPKVGWGPFPPFPPLIFGGLTWISGDIHIALYLAVIISTVLQGWALTQFFHTFFPRLGFWEAFLASLWFIKFPWFAVRFLQFPDLSLASDYSIKSFLGRMPTDAFMTVEAGLFTYFPYLAFLISFWLLISYGRYAAFTGILAGLLTYVYFYHQVFAFLLISTAAIVAFMTEGWNKSKSYVVALGIGLVVAIPHYFQLWLLSEHVDLFEYIQRLGFEDGRFSFHNLLYLRYLPGFLLVGVLYGIVRRPSMHKSLCSRAFVVIVISYVAVLNLRIVLGFDMNSDHYWRQSLGLPATLWMVVAVTDLVRDLIRRSRALTWGTLAATRILGVAILVIALIGYWGTWGLEYYETKATRLREHISDEQKDMVARMQLLKTFLQPGEVLLVADPATAYHAVLNLRARLFAPSGMSVLSNSEILERYFVAQYFSGSSHIRGPKDSGRPRLPDRFVHVTGEQLFLFVNYNGKDYGYYELDDEMKRMIHDVSVVRAEKIYTRNGWRVDVIFGNAEQVTVALERIKKHFSVLQVRDTGDYWVARVGPKV